MDDKRLHDVSQIAGHGFEVGRMQARHEAVKNYMRITNRMFFLFFFGFLNTVIGATLINVCANLKPVNQNLIYAGGGLVGLSIIFDIALIRMSLRYGGLRKGYPIMLTIILILAFGMMRLFTM
jgi:hypothetical protein